MMSMMGLARMPGTAVLPTCSIRIEPISASANPTVFRSRSNADGHRGSGSCNSTLRSLGPWSSSDTLTLRARDLDVTTAQRGDEGKSSARRSRPGSRSASSSERSTLRQGGARGKGSDCHKRKCELLGGASGVTTGSAKPIAHADCSLPPSRGWTDHPPRVRR